MLVVQASKYIGRVDSLTVCPITSMDEVATLFRIRISAADTNGLDHESVICVDKISTIRSDKVREVIGLASQPIMRSVDEALKRWLAL